MIFFEKYCTKSVILLLIVCNIFIYNYIVSHIVDEYVNHTMTTRNNF